MGDPNKYVIKDMKDKAERSKISEFLTKKGAQPKEIQYLNNLLSNDIFQKKLRYKEGDVVKSDPNYPKNETNFVRLNKAQKKLLGNYELNITYDESTKKVMFNFGTGERSEIVSEHNLESPQNDLSNGESRFFDFRNASRKGLMNNIVLCYDEDKDTLNAFIERYAKDDNAKDIDGLWNALSNDFIDNASPLRQAMNANKYSFVDGIKDFLANKFDNPPAKKEILFVSRMLMVMNCINNEEGRELSFGQLVDEVSKTKIGNFDSSDPTTDEVNLLKMSCSLHGFDESAGQIFNQFSMHSLSEIEQNRRTRSAAQDTVNAAIEYKVFEKSHESENINKEVYDALDEFSTNMESISATVKEKSPEKAPGVNICAKTNDAMNIAASLPDNWFEAGSTLLEYSENLVEYCDEFEAEDYSYIFPVDQDDDDYSPLPEPIADALKKRIDEKREEHDEN